MSNPGGCGSSARRSARRNPVYDDAGAAKAAGYAATPVPPTYLFCLEMMDAEQAFEFLTVLGVDLAQCAARRTALHLPGARDGRRHAAIRAAHRQHYRQEGRRDDAGRRRNQGHQPARRPRRGLLPHGRGAEQGEPHERNCKLSSRSATASSTRRFRRSAVTSSRSIAARRAITIRSTSTSISPRPPDIPMSSPTACW